MLQIKIDANWHWKNKKSIIEQIAGKFIFDT